MMNNKKGFAGMGLMVGLITGVMVFFMFSALLPATIQILGTGKGSNSANCPGYIDPVATATSNYTYDSTKSTDTIVCSILNFTPGMWVLSVVFAIIAGIISGKFSQAEPQQQYSQYGGY
jgi:hypothetical protein